ncbi:MAG: SH3 domain-containing protein [Clostridium sp.]|nr:SH3 domain-containing protein [Clostridium sp.]
MEENTMSKNDAEESRSVSEGVERSAESAQERAESENDSHSAAQRTGNRRSEQTAGRERTGSRRTDRTAGDGQTGSRRIDRTAGGGQTGSRRARRADEGGQAGSRRARRADEDGQTGSRRARRADEDRQTGSRRASGGSAEKRETDRSALRAEQGSGAERPVRIDSSQKEENRARQREAQSAKFGLGHQKTRRSAIAYFFEDIAEAFVRAKDWCVKNYRTSIPAAICLVLVIVVACILVRNFRMQPEPVSENQIDQIQEYPLEKDAYEHVNTFFQRYYEASTYGDVETYASMRSYTDATERVRMQKKANYIDYYQNLSCYTKPGPIENSYLVYVYYEVKFRGISTPAPGLKTFYLCTNDAGELYVFSGEVDQNVDDYMRTVSLQEDVKDLFNRVKVTYNNAVASDKDLETFLETLAEHLTEEVKLALAEEAEQNPDEQTENGGEESAEPTLAPEEPEPTPEPEPEPQTDRVMTTDRVNVRTSASPEATKLGTVAAGTQFTRYESLENGWSKIDYEGSEAYIKTEYLQVIETTIGKVKALESVNVRASASEDATKLGTVSVGTTLELIENQENGWSRILFNGSTAYVKTEYLDIENMTQ